jgi:hypothetical protein
MSQDSVRLGSRAARESIKLHQVNGCHVTKSTVRKMSLAPQLVIQGNTGHLDWKMKPELPVSQYYKHQNLIPCRSLFLRVPPNVLLFSASWLSWQIVGYTCLTFFFAMCVDVRFIFVMSDGASVEGGAPGGSAEVRRDAHRTTQHKCRRCRLRGGMPLLSTKAHHRGIEVATEHLMLRL